MERSMSRFLAAPPTVRSAMRVIVVATLVTIPVGGIAVRLADPDDVASVGDGMWWTLQTATTVGYGDVVIRHWAGRLIGGAVMLFSVAFIAIVTASVTSSFVERARREHLQAEDTAEHDRQADLDARLDDLAKRLERIETAVGAGGETR
jgi:voltage-gated potassium channel Kch